MREPGSRSWSYTLALAAVSMLAVTILTLLGVEFLADHVLARNRGSLEGVLRAAQGFAELGDQEVVEQCIRVARSVAARSWTPRPDERVRAFAERWDARTREADHLGLMP